MSDIIQLPNPEGVVRLDRVESEPIHTPSPTHALWQLAATHAFFNHGLFFTAGHLDVDPVQDYWVRHDLMGKSEPLMCQVAYPLPFPGMPGKARVAAYWGGVLLAVEKEHWTGLFDSLRGVAAVDRQRNFYWQASFQSLSLIDPSDTSAPHALDVTLFGVNSSRGHWGFHSEIKVEQPLTVWPISAAPVDPQILKIRAAITADSHQHLRVQEPQEHAPDVRGIDPDRIFAGL